MKKTSPSGSKAEEQAIKWLARLNASDLSAQDEQTFMDWLAASPVHQAAYIKAEQLWQEGEVLAEFAETKGSTSFFGKFLDMAAWQNRGWQGVAAACSVILLCVVTFLVLPSRQAEEAMYETLVGEQKEIHLLDGSQLTINTNSKLHVVLEKNRRLAQLVQGEVFFEVSADPHRPFEVITPNGFVRVVGTQFSVRTTENDTQVTVLEGKVAVMDEQTAEQRDGAKVLLTANESISMAAAVKGEAPTSIDAHTSLAWRNKQLIFRNENLANVLNELDRYLPQNLILADASLGEREITAVIKLKDLEKAAKNLSSMDSLQSLEISLNLHIRQQDEQTLVFEEQ